jgi:hypothetical protein
MTSLPTRPCGSIDSVKAYGEYNEDNACAKCGCVDAKTVYKANHGVRTDYSKYEGWPKQEFILRICDRCGFSWAESPLDQDG